MMMKMRIIVAAVAAVVLCRMPMTASAEMLVVHGGEARVPVIVAEDAPEATMQAVEDLVEYIEKISGARPKVIAGKPDAMRQTAIWVGVQPGMDEFFPDLKLTFDHPEEILIHSDGHRLLIAGRDIAVQGTQTEFGTANAVYTFIQDYLDVRWLWPGPLGEDIVLKDTLMFDPMEYRHHPIFRQRSFRRRGQWAEKGEQTDAWHRVQRITHDSFQFTGGHAFTDWWEKYHEDHPEYFALQQDGTRDAVPEPKYAKLCLSNPVVQEQWLDNAEALLKAEPARVMVSASPNDAAVAGECVCENCEAWDPAAGPQVNLYGTNGGYQNVSLTDRYITFWNILARGLKERFPDRDVYVGGEAYGAHKLPPVEQTPAHIVAFRHVGHFPTCSLEQRAKEKKEWIEWAEKAPLLVYRPNLFHYSGGTHGLPCVAMQRTIEDFRFLAENSSVGFDVDIFPEHWATQGPQLYLMAQLAYDPLQDGQALLDDWYSRAFGAAAGDIKNYFELMEKAQYAIVERTKLSSGAVKDAVAVYQDIYSDAFLDQAEALLKAAETKGVSWQQSEDLPFDIAQQAEEEGAKYRERIAFVRTGFDFTRMIAGTMRAMTKVRESGGKDVAAVKRATELTAAREALFVEQKGKMAINEGLFTYFYEARKMQDYYGPPSDEFRAAAGLEIQD